MSHVAAHLICGTGKVSHRSTTCGFCGSQGSCTVGIKETSRKGSEKCYSVVSNCAYAVKFSLKTAGNSTRRLPTTNHPIRCDKCSVVVWSYNMALHKTEEHDEDPKELISFLTSDEVKRVRECV